MGHTMDEGASLQRLCAGLRAAFAAHGQPEGRIELAQAPGAVDVMGGLCEDRGALVLTTTLALAVRAVGWESGGSDFRLLIDDAGTKGKLKEITIPVAELAATAANWDVLSERCRAASAEWATPAILVTHRAIIDQAIPRPVAGLTILLQSDFPADADLGRPCATATAVLDGLCKLYAKNLEPWKRGTLASEAAMPLTGLRRVRAAMTAYCGKGEGALMQLRFRPQPICEPLALPNGVVLTVVRTQLGRPTKRERLLETKLCAEMGERMIHELRARDGMTPEKAKAPLAMIPPADYVENYRNRLPLKITAKAFTASFGTFSGLDGGEANGKAVYKVRSRLEHHIYENQRVQEFVSFIGQARRTGAVSQMNEAGERMYASHWSYSQRCGIGGAEADRITQAVRRRDPADGLFGAKVTGGGGGGEVIVLMRNDERAHAALAEAIQEAAKPTNGTIAIHKGSLCGAEGYKAPDLGNLIAS
jgi:galactokinase